MFSDYYFFSSSSNNRLLMYCASESFEAEKELEGKMESLGNGRKGMDGENVGQWVATVESEN
jgi:hypothetical protein